MEVLKLIDKPVDFHITLQVHDVMKIKQKEENLGRNIKEPGTNRRFFLGIFLFLGFRFTIVEFYGCFCRRKN